MKLKIYCVLLYKFDVCGRRVDGETRLGVFAGRDILAGEELNYDYKYYSRPCFSIN